MAVEPIHGKWSEGQDEQYALPVEIIVNIGEDNVDGSYMRIDGNFGTIIYRNTDNILKINYESKVKGGGVEDKDNEIYKQLMAGEHAPEIYYHSRQQLNSDIALKYFFNQEEVEIIIMEGLFPPTWTPIREKPGYEENMVEILDFIYQLVYVKRLKNTRDFVGFTGAHLFISDSGKLKAVDFGEWELSTEEEAVRDFMNMVYEVYKYIYNPRLNGITESCNEKILDLGAVITDDCYDKEEYEYLIAGRNWLENKLRPPSKRRKKERARSKKKKTKRKKKKQTKKIKKYSILDTQMKSTRRKSNRRKSTRRKSTRRKSTRRKSTRRKSACKSVNRKIMKGGATNELHEGDWSPAGHTADNWHINYGDIKSHMYGYPSRADYYLYLKHDTNAAYRKGEGYDNHIHIWNEENGVGYKLKGSASEWENQLKSVAYGNGAYFSLSKFE